MEKEKINKYLYIVIFAGLLIAALLSITILGRKYTDPTSYAGSIASLNEKKLSVEKLAGSAAASSAAITLMPGDFGTPIADKLADLSGYFLLILVAIYIEKFLVSIAGILAFDILIPIGLVLIAVGLYTRRSIMVNALRIVALGLLLVLLIPASLCVSDLVERQYADEINHAVEAANQNSEEIKGAADHSDDESIWAEFISKVKGGSTTLLQKMESTLSNFIDAVSVYIVTTCVIPVGILALGVWLIKIIFRRPVLRGEQ